MTLKELNQITRKLAADVDAIRSRVEEHGDDMRLIEDDGDLAFDAGYALGDAAALLEQAFDMLEECAEELDAALLESTEETVTRVDHIEPRTFINLIKRVSA
jgi:hypothetical protein